jgi:hypothetical protein
MKKHYKLIIGAILIFTSGLLLGGGIAYYVVTQKQEEREPLQKFKTKLFKLMINDLKLTPEQQFKVGKLLDKGMDRVKEFRLKHTPEILMIIKENHKELKNILSPEQWKDYEGYRNYKLDKIQKSIP